MKLGGEGDSKVVRIYMPSTEQQAASSERDAPYLKYYMNMAVMLINSNSIFTQSLMLSGVF